MSTTISGLATTDYSSLFSSSSTSDSSSTSSLNSSLYDYANIKNGSYGKLLNAYYEKNSSTAKTSEKITEDAKNSALVKSDAGSLKSAADALVTTGSKSVFNLTDIKDESGNTTKGYDYDAIYKAVKSFTEEYNSTVDSAGDSESTSVLRRTLSMTNATDKNANLLGKVGITIGEDNKLEIDEKTLKSADINDLKSLFSGVGSYAYNMSSKASMISDAATSEIQKMSNYSATGSYLSSSAIGNLYDGIV